MTRLLVLLALCVSLAGCFDAEQAAKDCQPHGGIKVQNAHGTGVAGTGGTDATVVCADGTTFIYEGWDVTTIPAPAEEAK